MSECAAPSGSLLHLAYGVGPRFCFTPHCAITPRSNYGAASSSRSSVALSMGLECTSKNGSSTPTFIPPMWSARSSSSVTNSLANALAPRTPMPLPPTRHPAQLRPGPAPATATVALVQAHATSVTPRPLASIKGGVRVGMLLPPTSKAFPSTPLCASGVTNGCTPLSVQPTSVAGAFLALQVPPTPLLARSAPPAALWHLSPHLPTPHPGTP